MRSKGQSTGYGCTWLERKSLSLQGFNHFFQVTNELDLFLPSRFPWQKDAQKPFLLGTWSREGFSPGGTTSPQLEWPRIKSLYCASNNQPIAILLELIVYFIPLFEKCDYAGVYKTTNIISSVNLK